MERRFRSLLLYLAGALAAVPGCKHLPFAPFTTGKDPAPQTITVGNEKIGPVTIRPAQGLYESRTNAEKRPEGAPAPGREAPGKDFLPATLPNVGTAAEVEPDDPMPEPAPKAMVGPTRPEKPVPPLVEALRCMLEDRHQ